MLPTSPLYQTTTSSGLRAWNIYFNSFSFLLSGFSELIDKHWLYLRDNNYQTLLITSLVTIIIIKRDLISVLSNCWGPIKDTKRARGRLDRNVAPCSRPTTTVIGPLHECKKVCPCTKALPRSGSRAWIKQGQRKRKERERDRKDLGQEADGKKGSPTKQNTSEELKQGLPTKAQADVKYGLRGGGLTPPSHRRWPPAPPLV